MKVEEHAEELARLETRNVGKPIADSRGEVDMVAEVFHFYAGAIDKHHGQTIPVGGGVDMTFHEPLGVVGLIVPWNFPLNIASWKLGPSLACGNTVVLKPAELTPPRCCGWPSSRWRRGFRRGPERGRWAGPRGWGAPRRAPRRIKISFTGSTEVGTRVMTWRGRHGEVRVFGAWGQVGQRDLRGR